MTVPTILENRNDLKRVRRGLQERLNGCRNGSRGPAQLQSDVCLKVVFIGLSDYYVWNLTSFSLTDLSRSPIRPGHAIDQP